jgi:DNA polymerase-3 subunit gamma/tau
MSYQVLARKWRPRNFKQIVGQSHVVRALVNALEANRLHHAFLFAGTRGVGKTTIARILAKCLNCEKGVTAEPCGTCSTCTEIDEGRYMDLIEVDAASRSKVEETRELMDNVQFAPSRGRYKVYLIDEVHMFSEKSFNALLKTLEEPPPHVKFLLATTDPQKLPVTVLSRCLQFNLKRLPADEIAAYLTTMVAEENIEAEPAAVRVIARAADGSMRDALSLLDQAVVYGGGKLLDADVKAMLGTLDKGHVFSLLDALADGDGPGLMEQIEAMASEVTDFSDALAEVLSELQRIAVVQVVPEVESGDEEGAETRRALAEKISPEDIQLYYQMGIVGRRDLPLAPDPRSGFEMAMLRMLAFRPDAADGGSTGRGAAAASAPSARATPASASPVPTASASAVSSPVPAAPSPAAPAPDASAAEPSPAPAPTSPPASDAGAAKVSRTVSAESWAEDIEAMGLVGLTRELAVNSVVSEVGSGGIRLQLSPGHAQLTAPRVKDKLEASLERYCGLAVRVHVDIVSPEGESPARQQQRHSQERQDAAVQAIENDAGVQAICETFGTEVDKELIRPVD